MSDKLTVVIDGQAVLEYDRTKTLTDTQLQYLDRMDEAMDKGFRLDQEAVEKPELQQRAQFVALQLVKALDDNNEALIAASCSYLANRMPDLQQVVVKQVSGKGVFCDLVFDQPYVQEATVQFMKPH